MGVTERDFRIAHDIWGKDVTSMRGQTKKTATPVADISVRASLVQKQQVLSVDIMFLESAPSLIAVATPLDLVLAVSLKTTDMDRAQRTAAAIKAGLHQMVRTMAGQGFDVTTIYSDGEGAIGKLKYHLNRLGIELDISGAGGHVPRIERKIQMVKERARAYLNRRLPFTPTALGIALLVLFIVVRMTFQKSGETGGCPREEFTGRRVDGSFGDYVVCTVPDTKNNMDTGDRRIRSTTNRQSYGICKSVQHSQTIITRDHARFSHCMPQQSGVCRG
jgi:hypothetical protein